MSEEEYIGVDVDAWQDCMDFEAVVQQGLEEEDDMNEGDAAFMRGYLDESTQRPRVSRRAIPVDDFASELDFVRMHGADA